MPKLVELAVLAPLTFAALLGMAQQPTAPKIKSVPLQQTSPASGQQMYSTYCAVCHGASGIGDGPAAQALKIPPPDLTSLTKSNHGVFPSDRVESALRLGTKNGAHGTSEMPIWGDLMTSLSTGNRDSSTQVNQRILNLTNYLKKIQK